MTILALIAVVVFMVVLLIFVPRFLHFGTKADHQDTRKSYLEEEEEKN
jgi:uncharacterized membrane protein